MQVRKEGLLLFTITLSIAAFVFDLNTPYGLAVSATHLVFVFAFLWLAVRKRSGLILGSIITVFIITAYFLGPGHVRASSDLAFRLCVIATAWTAIFLTIRNQSLRKSEDQQKKHLRAIFDHATEGMLVCNSKGRIVTINQFAEKLFGYNKHELLGETVEKLIPSRFTQQHSHQRSDFMLAPQTRPMGAGRDLYGRHKSGREIPLEISLSHYQHEEETFVVAFILDITERKKASESVRREKQLAQKYLDIAPLIFLVLNRQNQITLINQYGCSILGYTEKDLLGRNWINEFVPADAREAFLVSLSATVRGSEVSTYSCPLHLSTGEERIICWKLSPIFDLEGQLSAILSAGEDITERIRQEELIKANLQSIYKLNEELELRVNERTQALAQALEKLESSNQDLQQQIIQRKRTEEQLKKSQGLYNAMAKHFPDGIICVINKQWEYVLIDGQELDEIGPSATLLMGEKVYKHSFPLPADDARRALRPVFQGKHAALEFQAKERYYQASAVPLPDAQAQVNEILVVVQNISQRKRMEEGLRKALEKEKELGEMKSRFVTTASHEFRTPLSTILSSAFLLENYSGETYEKEKAKHLLKIQQATRNMTNILNEFLSLEKIADGKVQVNYSRLTIETFINQLILEVESLKKPEQTIVYTHEGVHEVESDPQILRNIMYNLLSNAIKYSPPSSKVEVSTELKESQLMLQVKDNGIGIPADEHKYIFKRFFRARNAAYIEGTGLGLHIVKKYVKVLHGSISFESQFEQGTCFRLYLPIRQNTRKRIRKVAKHEPRQPEHTHH